MGSIPSGVPPGLTPSQLNYAATAQWKQLIRQALTDARVATPAFLVEDLNVATQTATVQIAIQERVRTASGAQWWDIPPITNVPIILPRGGGYSVTLPLKKGDEGMLVFCDTCFDNWWVNGQTSAPKATNVASASGSQTQFEVRRHYVHDCGFMPGMWSQPNVLENYSAGSLQIRTDDGNTIVDVAESGVRITGGTVVAANGGAAQTLVTDAFYQWFVASILPILQQPSYTPYTGALPPTNSETTILKGQ